MHLFPCQCVILEITNMKNLLPILSLLIVFSCSNNNVNTDFTGNSVSLNLIPGSVQGNETNGILEIRETSDGLAQINIELYNVLNNANHPVHLHFGSLADDGNVATILNPIIESEGTGFSQTIINELEDGTKLSYSDLLNFDGSIKIHFEASGPDASK